MYTLYSFSCRFSSLPVLSFITPFFFLFFSALSSISLLKSTLICHSLALFRFMIFETYSCSYILYTNFLQLIFSLVIHSNTTCLTSLCHFLSYACDSGIDRNNIHSSQWIRYVCQCLTVMYILTYHLLKRLTLYSGGSQYHQH